MLKMTTKSIYSLNKGESVVLSIDDKEYKNIPLLPKNHYLIEKIDIFSVMVTKIVDSKNYHITFYGQRLDGKQGITGTIEGHYTEEDLVILKENTRKNGQTCLIQELFI